MPENPMSSRYRCLRCDHRQYDTGELRAAGGFWSKIFDVQGRRFTMYLMSTVRQVSLSSGGQLLMGGCFLGGITLSLVTGWMGMRSGVHALNQMAARKPALREGWFGAGSSTVTCRLAAPLRLASPSHAGLKPRTGSGSRPAGGRSKSL